VRLRYAVGQKVLVWLVLEGSLPRYGGVSPRCDDRSQSWEDIDICN
jgi:hypothetical protein